MTRLLDAVRLARDTFATGSWMGVRLLSLGVWLLAMAKLLPAADFGWLASALGIAAVCSMFVGAGIPYLFFADAHEESQQRLELRWSELLGCLCISCPIVVLLAFLGIVIWMPLPVPKFLLLGLLTAEIVVMGLVQSSALFLHAMRNFGAASGLPTMMTGARAVAACVAFAMGTDLSGYVLIHLAMALIMAAVVMEWAAQRGCRLAVPRVPTGATLKAASQYALMAAGSLTNSEFDKPMLARIAGLAVTGHYALAYRICSAIAMPVTALSAGLLPRWARMLAADDYRSLRRSFVSIFLLIAVGSALASATLQVLLDVMPLKRMGVDSEVISLMRGLIWIVGPIGLHQFAGTALLASSRPLLRAAFDLLGLCLLGIGFLYFYGRFGIQGLATACVLAEGAVASLMAIVFLGSTFRPHRSAAVGETHG